MTYDHDFDAWANEPAALLRGGTLTEADIEVEEIESMDRSERRELANQADDEPRISGRREKRQIRWGRMGRVAGRRLTG